MKRLALILGLVLTVSTAAAQPAGPRNGQIDPCFYLSEGACLHLSLFSSADCLSFPNPCGAVDGDGPVLVPPGTNDPLVYTRWAISTTGLSGWGGFLPPDIRSIIMALNPTAGPVSDADKQVAAVAISMTQSWTVNPLLDGTVWKEQLRSYFCLQTKDAVAIHRCTVNGYLRPGSPTATRTVTPTGTATSLTPAPTGTRTPTGLPTATPTACVNGQTQVVQGPFGPVLLVCVNGVWLQATPTASAATRTPTKPVVSATPTPQFVCVTVTPSGPVVVTRPPQ
jgi:hypothetical protein